MKGDPADLEPNPFDVNNHITRVEPEDRVRVDKTGADVKSRESPYDSCSRSQHWGKVRPQLDYGRPSTLQYLYTDLSKFATRQLNSESGTVVREDGREGE